MFKKTVRILPALIMILSVAAVSAVAQTKLLRFPDIHGDRVAFTFGGDIWTFIEKAPGLGLDVECPVVRPDGEKLIAELKKRADSAATAQERGGQ